MNQEVWDQCAEIFRDVFEDDEISLSRETNVADIDSWDSLNHITLVTTIEQHFRVKFTTSEIMGWQNVGDFFDTLTSKIQ